MFGNMCCYIELFVLVFIVCITPMTEKLPKIDYNRKNWIQNRRYYHALYRTFLFLFLPVVFTAYGLLPHEFRWVFLLIASYYFYMSWSIKYVSIILFITAISYGTALLMSRFSKQHQKKLLLVIALIMCLGVLFVFKYIYFFSQSLAALISQFVLPVALVTLKLILPVGISFYTFQMLSYVIDVYRGEIELEKHFGKYALFVSFFHSWWQAPSKEAKNLLPQFRQEKFFQYDVASYGMRLILWGAFKKMVIADSLAYYVDAVFNSLVTFQGCSLLLAVFFFTIQIYYDFLAILILPSEVQICLVFSLWLILNVPTFRHQSRSSGSDGIWSMFWLLLP